MSRYTATPIELSPGEHRTGVDVALFVGATISGTVSRPAGVTAGSIDVVLQSAATRDAFVTSARVDRTGRYVISGIPAGRYKLLFEARGMNAASEYWKNQPSWSKARPLTLAEGQTRRISAALAKTSTISGKVVLPRGSKTSRTSIVVQAFAANERTVVGSASVRENGTYTIARLPAGTYKVLFAGAGTVAGEWWRDKTDWAKATRLSLPKGTDRKANATLAQGKSTITGKITGSRATVRQGAYVTAYRLASDGAWEAAVAAAATNARTGAYTLVGLTAGTHTVRFDRIRVEETCEWESEECVTPPGTVLTKWWKNKPDAESATRIALSANRKVTGVSTDLDRAPTMQILTKKVPKITGTAAVGETLTAFHGAWTKGTSFTYRWYADGKPIAGASKRALVLTSAERGTRITVKVTGTKEYYARASATSSPTPPVR